MEDCHVGATIIYHPEEVYILHERKKGKDNGEVGKLGLYGGQFDEEKGDKTIRDTAQRELGEESGIWLPPEQFWYEDYVFVISERDGEEILTEADIFLVNLSQDFDHEEFINGIPKTPRETSRAKALGELSTVAYAALTKIRGI
jgi:hypothetical protein